MCQTAIILQPAVKLIFYCCYPYNCHFLIYAFFYLSHPHTIIDPNLLHQRYIVAKGDNRSNEEGGEVRTTGMSQAVCYKPDEFQNEELIWFGLCFVAKQVYQKTVLRDFPGCPVVRTWRFHCCGPRFNPWLGTKILQAARWGRKNQTKPNQNKKLF